MIRSLRPTDLVALIFFALKNLTNEAQSWERLGKGAERVLALFFQEGLPLSRRRHTLVSVHGPRIGGLVSARRRSGPSAWEIDRLFVSDEETCCDLLEKLCSALGGRGVERLFLRLASGSPLVEVAKPAGFSPYLTEFLYRYQGEGREQGVPLEDLRPKSSRDDHRLFRLYNACVPAPVRSAEGMTFREWQESREGGPRREFVCEREGNLSGWLGVVVNGKAGYFELLASLGAELEGLVSQGLVLLGRKAPIFCLVPEFQESLRSLLEGQGFEQVACYCLLVGQLAVRARQPHFMPLRA